MTHQFPEGVKTRNDVKEWILEQGIPGGWQLIEHKGSNFGKHLWLAIKPERANPRVQGSQAKIMLYTLEKVDGLWGFQEFEEGMCDNYTDCPESLLELVGNTTSAAAKRWRKRVLSQ